MLGSRKTRRVLFVAAVALAAGGIPLGPATADGVNGWNIVSGQDGAELVPDDLCYKSAPGEAKNCARSLDAGRWAVELRGLHALHTQWRIEVISNRLGRWVSLLECSSNFGSEGGEYSCRLASVLTSDNEEGAESMRFSEGPVYSNGRIVFRLAEGGEVRATASGDTAAVVFTVSRLPDDPNDVGTVELPL